MRRFLFTSAVVFFLFLVPVGHAQEADRVVRLFMSDGQFKSHPIRVYVTADIAEHMKPELRLTGRHTMTDQKEGGDRLLKPVVVARHQTWMAVVEGEKVSCQGTLLLFDLNHYPIPFYKAMMRLTPTLKWQAYGSILTSTRMAVGDREVYVGNSVGAFGWSLLLIAMLVLFIGLMARGFKGRAADLFRSPDGYLSLWRTQLAAWTVAIGGVTVGYGMIRLEVPQIPESLVALMGLSLATGGISYARASGAPVRNAVSVASPAGPGTARLPRLRLSDLVVDTRMGSDDGDLSIAKAQMVFWTGLMLTLFVTKSMLDGTLWEVPWQMVTLMGMSQAGYLGPKLYRGRPSNECG